MDPGSLPTRCVTSGQLLALSVCAIVIAVEQITAKLSLEQHTYDLTVSVGWESRGGFPGPLSGFLVGLCSRSHQGRSPLKTHRGQDPLPGTISGCLQDLGPPGLLSEGLGAVLCEARSRPELRVEFVQ